MHGRRGSLDPRRFIFCPLITLECDSSSGFYRHMAATRAGEIFRGQKLYLFAAVVLIALVLTALFLFNRVKSEPAFEGRTVSEWIFSSDFETNRPRFDLAFLFMGESAVPTLAEKLHAGRKMDRRFLQNAKWFRRMWPIRWDQSTIRARTIAAIEVLGSAGRRATPDLLTVAQDKTEIPWIRLEAIKVLRAINADPVTVIPVLDSLKNDPDPTVKSVAALFAQDFREAAAVEARRKLDHTAPTNFLNRTSLWDVKPSLWETGK